MAVPDQILTLARKMSSDPAIQRQIAESFFRLSTSNPALGRRLLEGDPQAVMEAYQTLIRNNGSVPMPSGPPLLGARPIGPGETVGGVTGPGVTVNPGTGLVPATPRGLPHDPSATRQLTTTGGDAPDALDSAAREITVIDARPRGTPDDEFQLGDDLDDAGNIVIDTDVAPNPSRVAGPLDAENPFRPAVSERPRLGHSPVGPGVPVGGPAGGPRGMIPAGRRPPEVPPWVPPAATAALAAGLGGAIYMGTRPGETPAPSVDDKLEAAANPVTPDPEVGRKPAAPTWRDMADEEMVANLPKGDVPGGGAGVRRGELEAYGNRYRQAISNTIDRGVEARQAARRAGYSDIASPVDESMGTTLRTDNRSAYGPMHTFAPGATVVVDGVRVPAVDLGDGNLRYRLGDVKRAQEAEAEASRVANVRDWVESDKEKYGDYTLRDGDPRLSESQVVARQNRRDAAARQREQLLRARAFQIANKNRELTPYEAEQKARRDRVAARAMLAGGSQNITPQNAAAINALVELEGVDPASMDARQRNLMYAAPGGQGAAAVDAAGAQNAMRMIQPILTAGAGGTLGLFGRRDPMMVRDMQRMDALRLAAGQAYTGATYAEGRRRAVNDALIRAGASAAERARLMEEYFGSEPPSDVPATPPLAEVDAGMMPPMSL